MFSLILGIGDYLNVSVSSHLFPQHTLHDFGRKYVTFHVKMNDQALYKASIKIYTHYHSF